LFNIPEEALAESEDGEVLAGEEAPADEDASAGRAIRAFCT